MRSHRRSRKLAGVVKELGFADVLVRPITSTGDVTIPITSAWKMPEARHSIGFHERAALNAPARAVVFFRASQCQTLSFPMGNMFACADMILGRRGGAFPNPVAYLEGNCACSHAAMAPGRVCRTEGVAEHPNELEPLEFPAPVLGRGECDEASPRKSPTSVLKTTSYSTPTTPTSKSNIRTRWNFFKAPSAIRQRKYLWDNCRGFGFGY